MDEKFSFVDFLPECQEPGGIFSKPNFANFRTLVDRANDWLRTNPRFEVITCESVEFETKRDDVKCEKMAYLEYGEGTTAYVRGLRLWVREKESDKPQQIGYLNLVPDQVDGSDGIYESLDDVVSKFNSLMHTRPIPGRIITIETQEMKRKLSKEVDPDRSYWEERGQTRFLFFIRIFFEISDGDPEDIGIVDFVPKPISSGGIFSWPQYEPFSNVVEKASVWSKSQQGIRICNLQSVEIKVKKGKEVNTKKMDYTEHGARSTYYGGRSTFYIRILRLAYTKIRKTSKSIVYSPMSLTCLTFFPLQLTSGWGVPQFEDLHATKGRLTAWVRATGATVISAETAILRMYANSFQRIRFYTEATFTYNQGNEYGIYVIRIYINGSPPEPSKEMLPPVPEIEKQWFCTIS